MDYPKTRIEARDAYSEFYFTGKPCKHGHIAPRITKRGQCVECRKAEWQAENERRKTLPKSEASKASGRRYYEKNRELTILRAKISAERNLETVRESKRNWKARNKDYTQIDGNVRRRRLREATPKWVDSTERARIKTKYAEARRKQKETGVRYVVDHDIPLKGERVCGLHVYENLVVMPFSANARKSNKF